MRKDVFIRRAAPGDTEALGRMGAALARQHHEFDPGRFMLPEGVEAGYRSWLGRELRQPDAVVLVAELDGTVVGYAYGRMEGRDWNLLLDAHGAFHDLWVEPTARRLGAGARLAEALCEALQSLGAVRVVLMSATANTPAQRLFARLGWRPSMVEMTRELPKGPASS